MVSVSVSCEWARQSHGGGSWCGYYSGAEEGIGDTVNNVQSTGICCKLIYCNGFNWRPL